MTQEIQDIHDAIHAALEAHDGHALRDALEDLHAVDIAEVIDLLDDVERSELLYALPPRTMAEVVVALDEAVRGEVVEDLADEQLTQLVTEMEPDDAADVVAELPIEQYGEILDKIPQQQSDEIAELLSYDESSAGGIMTPRLVSLRADSTVGEASDAVRDFATDEDVHYVYVVDADHKLLGILPLRRLVTNKNSALLSDICETDPVTVHVDDDQEDVLNTFRKYDIAAVPVVNNVGVLVGRVTHDDVMDVAAEEAAEDIYRMAGTDAAELETHSSFKAASIRMRWLLPCIVGTLAAGGMMAMFEQSTLAGPQLAALVIFVPMIAATSGNAGIQTSTIVLRGFATGELVASKWQIVFNREARIAVLVGVSVALSSGLLAFLLLVLLKNFGFQIAIDSSVTPFRMGLAVSLGMLGAIAESVALGILLPFVFRRRGVDPAIASGPLITSANDLLSVTLYLSIAWLILH